MSALVLVGGCKDPNAQHLLLLLSCFNSEHSCLTPEAASGERSSARLAAVHAVTEEEARSKAYSIEDVVMPLPGSQVQYPVYRTSDGDEASTTAQDTVGKPPYSPSVPWRQLWVVASPYLCVGALLC